MESRKPKREGRLEATQSVSKAPYPPKGVDSWITLILPPPVKGLTT
jgi:hypothetical protein